MWACVSNGYARFEIPLGEISSPESCSKGEAGAVGNHVQWVRWPGEGGRALVCSHGFSISALVLGGVAESKPVI